MAEVTPGFGGTVGHVGCFSLQQSKHITAGDGGLTISDDPDLARRARLFADKAWPRDTAERTHLFLGLNYRMTELQAAVARVQLTKLADVVADRRRLAEPLGVALDSLPGLTSGLRDGAAYWLYPVFVDAGTVGIDAHAFAAALAAEGIPANGGYIQRPLYLTPLFTEANTYGRSGYPLTARPPMPSGSASAQHYAAGLCPTTEALIDERLFVLQWNENYTAGDVEDIVAGVRTVHQRFTS